jgi:cephalosporin hydroxylase
MNSTGKCTLPGAGRSFATGLSQLRLSEIQQSVLRTRYRGRELLKSPFDLVLYLKLLQQLQPRTIIEIGAKHGGSALWFADQTEILGTSAYIVSVDLSPPPDISDPRILFLVGDACDLGKSLDGDFLSSLPRPWLVTEDSAHTFEACSAVLDFFDPHIAPGEYVVIEDGIVSSMSEPYYAKFADGPNRAVHEFLNRRAGRYIVDEALCDFFGYNATWNPNGWL